jgi:putative lipoic acid-binding regulatory protein
MARTDDSGNRRDGKCSVEDDVFAALSEAHALPGLFPVVLIARREAEFERRLGELLTELQGAAPFTVSPRPSINGTYASYRVEVWVEDARQGVARRGALAGLPGVLVVL